MDFFGPQLQTKDGLKDTSEVLGGKYVGIYFSAHWCPPCRGFTPQLAKAYTEHLKAKDLEIVFVSSDRDEGAFDEYFAEMPWVALPYADRDRKDALSKKFKVQGIPSFVMLDKDGSTITTDGRSQVSSDPTGEDFPWVPKPVKELLGDSFLGKDGPVTSSALEGKVVALYFSAHWCPPCQRFTPQLAEQYKKIQAAGLPFELVFVSSDRDEGAFKEYFGEMPWLALPYEKRKEKEALSSRFDVDGIPSVVVLDKDRSVITKNGRGAVMGDLAEFPWHPKPVVDLAASADGINETLSVVVLAEEAGAEAQESAVAAMTKLAESYVAAGKAKQEDPEVLFFIAKSGEGPVGQIRKLTGTTGRTGACVVLLDIPDKGGFYVPEVELTEAGFKQLLEDHKGGKLERKQLG
jgi:nucleoredoxin